MSRFSLPIPEEFAQTPIGWVGRTYSPEMTEAFVALSMAVYKHLKVSLRECEAARMRIAQINGCVQCRAYRAGRDVTAHLEHAGVDASTSIATRGPAPDEAFYADIADWRSSSRFSERERLAIEFAERFALTPDEMAYEEEFWTRLKSAYAEAEIYDLTIAVGTWTSAGRFTHVLGFDLDVCAIHAPAEPAIAAE